MRAYELVSEDDTVIFIVTLAWLKNFASCKTTATVVVGVGLCRYASKLKRVMLCRKQQIQKHIQNIKVKQEAFFENMLLRENRVEMVALITFFTICEHYFYDWIRVCLYSYVETQK